MPSGRQSNSVELEPRVAKLESHIETLTRDVTSLASIVREQSGSIEKQIQELTIAVTKASGPQRTDWSVIISAVLLIMAIGSAVFWPLNQTANNTRKDIDALSYEVREHIKLPMHPSGSTRVDYLEKSMKDKFDENNNAINLAKGEVTLRLDNLQKEVDYIKQNGSGITRERLVVIENKLGIKK